MKLMKILTSKGAEVLFKKSDYLRELDETETIKAGQLVYVRAGRSFKATRVEYNPATNNYKVWLVNEPHAWYVCSVNVTLENLIKHRVVNAKTFDFNFLPIFNEYSSLEEDLEPDSQVLVDMVTQLKKDITVKLNCYQFTALVSFALDHGYPRLKRSRLLRFVKEENYDDAAKEFGRFNKVNGRIVENKVNLRNAERELFET